MTDDEVLEALPKNGNPMLFGAVCAAFPGETPGDVNEALIRLSAAGRAGVVYGRGWRRLPRRKSMAEIEAADRAAGVYGDEGYDARGY